MRGGIGPGVRRFRLRFVGVVDVWDYVRTGDDILPGCGGAPTFPRRATPNTRRAPGAPQLAWKGRRFPPSQWGQGSENARLKVIYQIRSINNQAEWDWDLHTVRGDADRAYHRFRPRCVGIVNVWKGL